MYDKFGKCSAGGYTFDRCCQCNGGRTGPGQQHVPGHQLPALILRSSWSVLAQLLQALCWRGTEGRQNANPNSAANWPSSTARAAPQLTQHALILRSSWSNMAQLL